jgi:hypothetical protein
MRLIIYWSWYDKGRPAPYEVMAAVIKHIIFFISYKYMENSKDNQLDLNPYYVTGICDGESCFHLAIGKNSRYKIGYYVNPVFSISLHKKDEELLKEIQKFFGGIGNLNATSNMVFFQVLSLKDLDIIIEHFNNYPLITKKYKDFEFFKQAILLIKNKEHLTIEGFNKILAIRASMNKGLPLVLKEAFPDIKERVVASKDYPLELNPNWVAGFTDGEGCFWIKTKKASGSHKINFILGFQVSQHNRDLLLMEKLVTFFKCGRLEEVGSATSFIVTKLSFLTEIIIPFFKEYSILGSKSKDFKDWMKAVELVKNKTHLTPEGVEEILKIKSNMNFQRILK